MTNFSFFLFFFLLLSWVTADLMTVRSIRSLPIATTVTSAFKIVSITVLIVYFLVIVDCKNKLSVCLSSLQESDRGVITAQMAVW